MKTLLAAAASLLALAAPAFAQNPDGYHVTHRHPALRHSHGGFHVRADRGYEPRYGSDDIYVREERRPGLPSPPIPSFAWRPEAEQEGVGADLIGPGSSFDNPTDQHDVSR